MPLFSVFVPSDTPAADPVVVPERFYWGAALFAPLWALGHGLLRETLVWLGMLIVIIGIGMFAGPEVAVWLYLLFAAWIGFSAPQIRARALERRGFVHDTTLVAAAADLAARDWYAAGRGL